MRSFTMLLAAAALLWGPVRGDAQPYAPPYPPPSAQPYPAADLYGGPQQATAEQYAAEQFYASQQAAWLNGEGLAPDYSALPAENTCCPDGTCGTCTKCCRRLDIWGSAEFLMWWGKGTITPPLVTTSPQGTPQAQAGVLPDATVLWGQEYMANNMQIGGRLTLGIWLDPDHCVSAVGRFYGTNGDVTSFSRSSLGDPILARPFYNVLLDQQDSLLVAFDDGGTDIVDGSVSGRFDNQNFLSAEGWLQIMMHEDQRRRVDLIGGGQVTRLDDGFSIDSTHILRQLFNTQLDIHDSFRASNRFYGGVIGLRGQMARGAWSIDTLGKIGLGVGQQRVDIAGSTVINGISTTPGGFLAQPTNIGSYSRNRFVAIPEFTTNLRYHLSPTCSVHVGYTLLFWSSAVVSGQQIDFGLNPSQFFGGPLVGEARPAFDFRETTYWMQGINFGVNWDF